MSKENKALEGALLITNPKDLSLRSGEEVFHLDIRLTVAQKHGEVFGDLRPIELGLWTPEHRTALAAVLIYCWEKCMRTRLMRDSIRSICEEAISQHWIKPSDLITIGKQLNKGGRPKGKVAKSTEQILSLFGTLKQSSTPLTEDEILDQIAEKTFPGRNRTPPKLAGHRNLVRRTLRRHGKVRSNKKGFSSKK